MTDTDINLVHQDAENSDQFLGPEHLKNKVPTGVSEPYSTDWVTSLKMNQWTIFFNGIFLIFVASFLLSNVNQFKAYSGNYNCVAVTQEQDDPRLRGVGNCYASDVYLDHESGLSRKSRSLLQGITM